MKLRAYSVLPQKAAQTGMHPVIFMKCMLAFMGTYGWLIYQI